MADLDVLKASPNTETLTLFSVQSSGRTKSRGAGATAHDIDPIQLYLNEIGETPLLTADEEVVVARASLAGDESRHGLNAVSGDDSDLTRDTYRRGSITHRRKVRAWQMLCALTPAIDSLSR